MNVSWNYPPHTNITSLYKENPRSCQGQNGSKYRGLIQLPKNDQINIFSISSLNAHNSIGMGIFFCRIWLSTQSVALYSPIRLRQRSKLYRLIHRSFVPLAYGPQCFTSSISLLPILLCCITRLSSYSLVYSVRSVVQDPPIVHSALAFATQQLKSVGV